MVYTAGQSPMADRLHYESMPPAVETGADLLTTLSTEGWNAELAFVHCT